MKVAIVAIVVLFARTTVVPAAEPITLFDADWKFTTGDPQGAELTNFDDSNWDTVELPHDWSIKGPIAQDNSTGSPGGFFPAGVGWYRKRFALPEQINGKQVSIRFDGVYMLSEVWINGHKLGRHPYGYTPFSYVITPYLNSGLENTIAVRVDNSRQMNSRRYTGSGIYRHVWLNIREPIHIQPDEVWVRTASISKESAKLRIGVGAENCGQIKDPELEYAIEIFSLDDNGKRIGNAVANIEFLKSQFTVHDIHTERISNVETDVEVLNPHLWSPDHPNCYLAVITLSHNGQEVDHLETTFGIRTVTISAEKGFLLNGERVELFGGCIHHDNGALGAAAFDRAEERKVQLLKSAGFNAIRTSHNPPAPAFLEACDRLGLMVIDEAFDCWEQGKNSQDYHQYFINSWQADLDAMIQRDQNHPSVIMWSIGNEIPDFGSEQGLRDGTMLINRVRGLDPTRPVTAAINWWKNIGGNNSWKWTDADSLIEKLDVAGYNYQIQRYAIDHQRMPVRAIVSTESYPHDFFECWEATVHRPWVVGDFVWTAMDYLGESGIGRIWNSDEKIIFHGERNQFPFHGAYCGDIDLTGLRKPVSYACNITWDRGEKLYVSVKELTSDGRPLRVADWGIVPTTASWTWPGHEGQLLDVEVYSRFDGARLYLNSLLIDEKPTTHAEKFKAEFSVPYAPGKLRIEGIQSGSIVDNLELTTAGPVSGIRLKADRTKITADGQDLAFVTVESIDEAGNFQPTGDETIKFRLTGPGTIAGVANADLSSDEGYSDNQRRLFHGRALVIIRTTHRAGTIELIATSNGLVDARQTIDTR